jgi:hypothetical protein
MRLLMADLQAHPGGSLPQACHSPAALKAAYRFLYHPETSVAHLLPAFSLPSARALARHRWVIVVQDSTSFNYTHLEHATGLGYLNDSARAKGFHLHSTLLLDAHGNLVGIAGLHFWVRHQFRQESDEQRRELPIEQKESCKWLLGLDSCDQLFQAVQPRPEARRPRLIHVMDREGDIHEVFARIRQRGQHAVIRCAQNRRVAGDAADHIEYAKQRIERQKALGTLSLRVPLQDGGYRTAVVAVRASEVRLRPDDKKRPGRRPLSLRLIEVREISKPPEGEKAARWWLWTTLRARKLRHVQRVLRIYRARWRVEEYHRALKTGCSVEKLRLQDGEALMRMVAMQAWVATRMVALRDRAKEDPEQDCENCFSTVEWKTLFARQHGRPWCEEDGKPGLGEVMKWLGRLGGHLGRKGDGLPGPQVLGRGLLALHLLLQGREIGLAETAHPLIPPPDHPEKNDANR